MGYYSRGFEDDADASPAPSAEVTYEFQGFEIVTSELVALTPPAAGR